MLTIGEFARLGQVSPRMLRHYDDLGLLVPERVGPSSGYRLYGVQQLGRLHKIVALRDLGFSLEQVRQALAGELPAEELRGMFRLRKAQIEQSLEEEQERLRRVDAHIRALEWSTVMDIVIKHTQPARVAVASASGLSHADIGAAFASLMPAVTGDCRELYHEWDDDDPSRNVMELQQPIARQATGAGPTRAGSGSSPRISA